MNWFEKALFATSSSHYPQQPPWGWFHITWIFAAIAMSVISALLMRKRSLFITRIFLLTYASIMILLEIWKILASSFHYNESTGEKEWKFNWGNFPFEFCSTPMYIALIASLICKGRIQNSLIGFLGLFGLTAAIAVFAFPTILGTSNKFLIFHTMIYHSGMVIVGVTVLVSKMEIKHKTLLWVLPVYFILVFIAEMLNIWYHKCVNEKYFNLFYISPYFPSSLQVLKEVQKVSFPLFFVTYLVCFITFAYILLLTRMFMGWCIEKIKKKIKTWRDGKTKERCVDLDVESNGLLLADIEEESLEPNLDESENYSPNP